MAAPSVTHILTNGTAADATQINTNFNDILSGFSDGTKDFVMASGNLSGNLVVDGNTTLGNASGDTITMNGVVAENILMADGKGIDFSRYTDHSVAGTTITQILTDYEVGTWTPYDGSGAELTLTVYSASYIKIGHLVWFNMMLAYPQTADGSLAIISGLPYTPSCNCYLPMFLGIYPNVEVDLESALVFRQVSEGGGLALSRTNANMSQAEVGISGSYYAVY